MTNNQRLLRACWVAFFLPAISSAAAAKDFRVVEAMAQQDTAAVRSLV